MKRNGLPFVAREFRHRRLNSRSIGPKVVSYDTKAGANQQQFVVWYGLNATIMKSIKYPLVTTTLSCKKCTYIMAASHLCGYNGNCPESWFTPQLNIKALVYMTLGSPSLLPASM